jgi:NADH dehydrogenase
MSSIRTKSRPHVVIVGGGFGGLTTAQALKRARVSITLVDRNNHHLFQPLLYQVAMAGLSPAEIASPIRTILGSQPNVIVLLDEVTAIDLNARVVRLRESELRYDYLVLATGAETNYFGHDEWARYAPGLKDLDDALEIRHRVLLALEAAERESDEEVRRRLTRFVVIGGGPTGVELAGTLSELARVILSRDFRMVSPASVRVVLVEAAPRILGGFPEDLSEKAVEQLAELGVEVRTGSPVTAIDEDGVHLGDDLIPSATVLWAAGVRATPLTRTLGVEVDRGGRVLVEPDCSIPGHLEAFAIGDTVSYLHQDGKPLPGVSPVAMQQARFVARQIVRDGDGKPREKFHYDDRGIMATIGRSRAVALIKGIKLSGFLAWAAWIVVHIFFLIGFRTRLGVMFDWAYSYFTYQRGARLITGHRLHPGPPAAEAPQEAGDRDQAPVS